MDSLFRVLVYNRTKSKESREYLENARLERRVEELGD